MPEHHSGAAGTAGRTGSASQGDTGSQRTAARSANSSRPLGAADQSAHRKSQVRPPAERKSTKVPGTFLPTPPPPGSRSRVAGAILWGQRWDRRMLRLGNLLSSQLGSIHGGLRVLTQIAAATVAKCELLYAQLLPFASRKHTHLAGHKTQPQPSTRSVVPTVRQCNILSVRRRRTEAAVGNKQTPIECCICCTKLLWHRTEIGFPGKFALAQGDTTLKLNGYKRLHKTCPINTKLLP